MGEDFCLSVRYGSASAVQKVESLSFIPRHGSRYRYLVSFPIKIKEMNKFLFNGAESTMPHKAATDPASPLGTLPSP